MRKYCKLTYNGVVIDDILDGYITINVEGRGLLAPNLSTTTVDGRDGDIIDEQKLPARNVVVHFVILAKSNEDRLRIIDNLGIYLQSDKDVKFSFADQEGYWIGRLSAAEDIPFDYYTGSGRFTLHCQNPYRHMETIDILGEDITISAEVHKKLILEEISLSVMNTEEVRVTNTTTGEVISLKKLDNIGELIISKDRITLNRKNIIEKLDHSISTWKKFKINNGDHLIISGATNSKTKIRRLL